MTSLLLTISLISILFVIANIEKNEMEKSSKLTRYFVWLLLLLILPPMALILQIMFSNYSLKPIYYDFVTYISTVFVPVVLFAISQEFKGGKKIKVRYLTFVPIISLLMLWTNDLHGLFYAEYSTIISEVKYGTYFYFHMVYTYVLMIVAFINVLVASIKKSGFISIQTGFIILGILAPLVPNALGSLKIISISIYVTPIMFVITAICFYMAIFRFKALNVVPIATKTIIDNMTDSFVVISEDGTIVDINKTCVDKFRQLVELKRNMNLFDKLKSQKSKMLDVLKKNINEAITKKETVTEEYHISKGEFDKYFDVDIQPVKAKHGNEYVAILLLIRDVTQEKKDIEIMTKNENLVILGELAGGVAHDINTPISAIKSGITMLKPMSRNEDETMLLNSMDSCADKIIALVNSLRNQIRNIGSEEVTDISITNVLGDIKLILNNELKKNNVVLELNIEDDIHLKGNPTKLSQVVINIVTNAVQAYEKKGGKVDVVAKKEKDTAKICITDYASGIPESVRPYIFKNILTTKGVSGTGFGLYLAYSVIKGAFGGDISFETETGKGTTFEISIPIN